MFSSIRKILKTITFSFQNIWYFDKKYFFIRFIKILPTVGYNLLMIYFPRQILDTLESGTISDSIVYTIYFVLLTILLSFLISYIGNFVNIRSVKLNKNLNEKLLRSISKMEYEKFESSATLDQFSYAKTCATEASITGIVEKLFNIFEGILSIFAYLYIIFEYSLFFFPIIILSMVVSAISQNKKDSEYIKIQEQTEKTNRKVEYASKNLTDYTFAKEIRAFQLKDYILDKYNFYIKLMYKLEFQYIKKVTPLEIVTAVVDALKLFVVYGLIGHSLWKMEISVGAFTQYISAFLALSATLNSIISSFVNLKTLQSYIEGYKSFTETEAISPKCLNIKLKNEHLIQKIEFKNVSFKYPGSDRWILKNIDLEITDLEKIALVGKNGAGKTTLVKLLLGLYKPTEGKILLNGIDINSFSTENYLKLFSVVFQDCNIYNYSVSENIAMRETNEVEKLLNCLRQVGVYDKILSGENGVNTPVTRYFDEKGADLSGGERQKLVIARALYKDAPVYIFDEPTSALSPESEYHIYESFSSISENKTVLYISHRLSSCKLCTRILVIDEGKIIENGTHQQLMNDKGLYYQMFNAQAELYLQKEG